MKRVAVITGASKGIGYGITEKFCQEGYAAAILSRGIDIFECEQKLRERQFDVKGFQCDISDGKSVYETVEKIMSQYGHIDVLVNNAGVGRMMPFEEIDVGVLDNHININIKGTWNMVQAVIPHMRSKKYGRIINLSSVTGAMVCDKGYTAYGMTKAAIVGLTKAIAVEYAEYGITCNAICPGYIETPNVRRNSALSHPDDPERTLREIAAGIPMKKLGTPRQVGAAALFLAGDETDYITGTTMVVDGGNLLPETGAVRF